MSSPAFRRIVKRAAITACFALNVGAFLGAGATIVEKGYDYYLGSTYGSPYTLRLETPTPASQSFQLDAPIRSLEKSTQWMDYAASLKSTFVLTVTQLADLPKATPDDTFVPPTLLLEHLATQHAKDRQETARLTLVGRQLRDQTAREGLLTQPVVVESEASLRGLKAENHAQYGQDLCRVVVNAKQIRGIRAELSLLEQSGEPSFQRLALERVVVQHELAHCAFRLNTRELVSDFLLAEYAHSHALTSNQAAVLSSFLTSELKKRPAYVEQVSEGMSDTYAWIMAAKEKWNGTPQDTQAQAREAWKASLKQWERWRFQTGSNGDHFTVPALATLSEFDPVWLSRLSADETVRLSRSLVAHSFLAHMSTQSEQSPELLSQWTDNLLATSSKGLSPSDAAKYQEMSSYLSTQNLQYLVVAPFLKADVVQGARVSSEHLAPLSRSTHSKYRKG